MNHKQQFDKYRMNLVGLFQGKLSDKRYEFLLKSLIGIMGFYAFVGESYRKDIMVNIDIAHQTSEDVVKLVDERKENTPEWESVTAAHKDAMLSLGTFFPVKSEAELRFVNMVMATIKSILMRFPEKPSIHSVLHSPGTTVFGHEDDIYLKLVSLDKDEVYSNRFYEADDIIPLVNKGIAGHELLHIREVNSVVVLKELEDKEFLNELKDDFDITDLSSLSEYRKRLKNHYIEYGLERHQITKGKEFDKDKSVKELEQEFTKMDKMDIKEAYNFLNMEFSKVRQALMH